MVTIGDSMVDDKVTSSRMSFPRVLRPLPQKVNSLLRASLVSDFKLTMTSL